MVGNTVGINGITQPVVFHRDAVLRQDLFHWDPGGKLDCSGILQLLSAQHARAEKIVKPEHLPAAVYS